MALTLKAMQYFTTALRLGSLTKAADALHISASAIATAIDQVEAEFDLPLVTRRRAQGIEATANGRAIFQKFERLLEDYAAVLQEGAELKQALSGPLRIGYYAPVAPAFLPHILRRMLPDEAEVTLHLEACDNDAAQDGLLTGAYDAILFVSDDARPAIDHDVLVTAPPYALLPEGHLLAEAPDLSIADLANEPLIVLNRPFAGAYYQRLFEAAGHTPRVAAHTNSTEMVRSLVGARQGVAILNMWPRTEITYAGDALVARPIADPLPALTLSVGYDKSAPRRLVRHFVEAARVHFEELGVGRCVVE